MNRSGTSLAELVVAVAIVGLGVVGVSSLTATAARTLVRARALDEAHAALQSFVDSARIGNGPASGERDLPSSKLTWNVPQSPGSEAWARIDHIALPAPIFLRFNVVSGGGAP